MTKGQLLALALAALPLASSAQDQPEGIGSAEILPGWRDADGSHWMAIRLRMLPGWHTYWRSPGDAGIPPSFDFSGSSHLAGVEIEWPRPGVFEQNGMRTLGYEGTLILPIRLTPDTAGAAIGFAGSLQIGVCNDVCMPMTLALTSDLPAEGVPDPAIRAALDMLPVAAARAGVGRVSCAVEPIADGLRVTASIAVPAQGSPEIVAMESADPRLWISESQGQRSGGTITASADFVPPDSKPFALDRSGIRLTVVGSNGAVDIRGCPGG
jgi:DsbC/DsbD-like thiol-disulfide interchange protein